MSTVEQVAAIALLTGELERTLGLPSGTLRFELQVETPRAVIGRLAEAVSRTVKSPEARERLIAAGLEVVDSTPAEYAAFRKRDLAMWARMIKEANIRPE